MAASNFCALVRSKWGDTPLVDIERKAGVQRSRNPLRHWFRDEVKVELPPPPPTIYQLARITGLDPGDIYLAFRRDSHYLMDKTDDSILYEYQRDWVKKLDEIPAAQRQLALRMIAALGAEPQTQAG